MSPESWVYATVSETFVLGYTPFDQMLGMCNAIFEMNALCMLSFPWVLTVCYLYTECWFMLSLT